MSHLNDSGWNNTVKEFPREFSSWWNMRTRCYNSNHDYWENYGGKGIRVCPQWLDGLFGFRQFLSDMGERPQGYTLERKELSKDYTPDNCIWESDSNQMFNRTLFSNNKSGITGVSWHLKNSCWTVYINKNGKRSYLGSRKDFFDACCIRKRAELKLYPDKVKSY